MITTLSDFPYFPRVDEVPLCEIDGKLHYAQQDVANLHVFTASVSAHPYILITNTGLPPITSTACGNRVFLPVTDSLSHRLQNAWYEGGLVQVLEILANPDEHNFFVGQLIAKNLLIAHDYLQKWKSSIFKTDKKRLVNIVKNQGPVICLAWHPHCSKLAVVSSDDSVNIFSIDCTLNPVLKSKTQRQVTSVAWRPLTSCEIAVACYEGVYIWCLDPNSVISRPSISCATLLQVSGHRNLSDVAWSPQGDVLVSASLIDRNMYIWDVEMRMNTPLRRVGGNGIGLLSWTPNGSKLVAATTSTIFRVWNVDEMWEAETWSTVCGAVVAAAWSPISSDILLFACAGQPFLYAMPSGARSSYFSSRNSDYRTWAHIAADFTRVTLESDEEIGGEVLALSWDRKGRHLAVMFKDCPHLAIMLTHETPLFHVIPGFFIKGLPCEIPTAISFQNDFEEGSNLTIAWNTGRIQYFPFIFSLDNATTSNITMTATSKPMDRSVHYYSFTSP